MLDILEWGLDVIGVTYKRLDGRYRYANLTFTVCSLLTTLSSILLIYI